MDEFELKQKDINDLLRQKIDKDYISNINDILNTIVNKHNNISKEFINQIFQKEIGKLVNINIDVIQQNINQSITK